MKRTEIVKAIYAGINKFDLDSVINFMSDDVERIEPEGFPGSGSYRGHEHILKQWNAGRSMWAEGACTPEDIIEKGDNVVALVHVHVRLKNAEKWIDARVADGYIFRGDKVIFMQTFITNEDAMTWAGIQI